MTFEEVTAEILVFRDERDWRRFHNPKDLALSISIEAGELLEVFQWSGPDTEVADRAIEASDELADVIIYCIYLADALKADISGIVRAKMQKNAERYPVEAARSNARKAMQS